MTPPHYETNPLSASHLPALRCVQSDINLKKMSPKGQIKYQPKFSLGITRESLSPEIHSTQYLYFSIGSAASSPGTKFAGIPTFRRILMIFSAIPGNPSEMEFLYQGKVSIAGHVSGNERYS